METMQRGGCMLCELLNRGDSGCILEGLESAEGYGLLCFVLWDLIVMEI